MTQLTKKESYFHKRITKEPIAFLCSFLFFDLLMLCLFVGFAMLPYLMGEYAYKTVGIQNWFHQIGWYIHIPLSFFAVPFMLLLWEYYIHDPFSAGFLSDKPYRYKFPRLSAWIGIPVPPEQLHKGH